jgi:hypothetical protein
MARALFLNDLGDKTLKNGVMVSDTLIFPQDMENKFFPEAIKFSIYKRSGVSYKNIKKKVKSSTAQVMSTTGNKENEKKLEELEDELTFFGDNSPTEQKIEELKAKMADDAQATKKRVDAMAAGAKKFAKDVKQDFDNSRLEEEHDADQHIRSIYLNMPESVAFSEQVEWQGADLGVLGAALKGGIEGAVEYGILSGAGTAIGGGVGALTNLIPGVSGIAAPIIGAALGSGSLQSGLESTFGVKANPYKEQTFQGVDFRSFEFTFTLRALSDGDVIVIQDIIRSFRAHSKPSFESKGESGVFAYPMEFKIDFLTIDNTNSYVTNKYLPEIKYCVCTGVNTNFTQQGWQSFEGGAPVDISLTLSFQETELVTSEDVMGNTQVGKFKESGRKF